VQIPPTLAQLGWTAAREMAFGPHAAAGLVPGRVALEHNHVYRVFTHDGERLAEAAGRMKHLATSRMMLPVVGDWVAIRPDPGGRALIREILPRVSAFSRKAAGRETDEQVIASNIDTLFVVFGLDRPVKSRAIERYLAVAQASGAGIVVVLNKADLRTGVGELEADLDIAHGAAGDVPVVVASMARDPNVGILAGHVGRGKTVAVIGPSGSGKSTMVNRLVGSEMLETGEVRAWDARGRHTSVHRQLVVLNAGGVVIDTPGMRELQLWETDNIAEAFHDIEAIAAACRFRDCRHESEPGCAVKAAVESGALDAGRHDSYLTLQREQAAMAEKRDERALSERRKREGRAGSKALKELYRARPRGRS
jgi:ribosome biogenesis GTPase